MKKFLLILISFCALNANAQYAGYFRDTTFGVETFVLYPQRSTTPAIKGAATAALSRTFAVEKSLYITGQADSLSGAVLARCILEYANTGSPVIWIPIDSVTLNGALPIYFSFTDAAFKADKFRLRYRGLAAGNFKVQNEWAVKPE